MSAIKITRYCLFILALVTSALGLVRQARGDGLSTSEREARLKQLVAQADEARAKKKHADELALLESARALGPESQRVQRRLGEAFDSLERFGSAARAYDAAARIASQKGNETDASALQKKAEAAKAKAFVAKITVRSYRNDCINGTRISIWQNFDRVDYNRSEGDPTFVLAIDACDAEVPLDHADGRTYRVEAQADGMEVEVRRVRSTPKHMEEQAIWLRRLSGPIVTDVPPPKPNQVSLLRPLTIGGIITGGAIATSGIAAMAAGDVRNTTVMKIGGAIAAAGVVVLAGSLAVNVLQTKDDEKSPPKKVDVALGVGGPAGVGIIGRVTW